MTRNSDPPPTPEPRDPVDPTMPARPRGGAGPSVNGPSDRHDATVPKTRDALTGSSGDEPVPFSPPPPGDPVPGSGGFAKFRFGDELGRGGVGVVRLARDTELRRDIAIKLLRNPDEPGRVDQFVEEAQITGQLEHPNIIPVHELGRDARGRPWLAMKRVSGDTLYAWIKRQHDRPLTPRKLREILGLFGRVCDAVAFAHSRRVIHRDLKPDNVLLGEFGEVLLGDWGLARPLTDDDRQSPTARPHRRVGTITTSRRDQHASHTVEGLVFGTPAYMPPEQASGEGERVDRRSDIFSLGGILYHMLTLQPPYRGPDLTAVVMAAATWRLVPPRRRNPKRAIPRELDAIVMKAMAEDPADRYRHVTDLQADLEAWSNYQPVSACRDRLRQRAIKWVRRHPTAAASLVLTLLFVALLGGVGSALLAQASSESQRRLAAEQREREAAEARARAEADAATAAIARERAEARQRELRLQVLAREGKLRELVEALGGKLRYERDQALDEFMQRWQRARESGLSDEQFMRQLSSEDVSDTLRVFERLFDAAERYPDQIRVTATDWFAVGLLYLGGFGDAARSEAAWTRAIELDDEADGAWANRGLARQKQGRLSEALDDFNRALELDPDNVAARVSRGNLYRRIGELQAALDDYNHAVSVDSEWAEAFAARGSLLIDLGLVEQGFADYERALQLRPGYGKVHYNRGVSYLELGQPERAVEDFRQAIRFEPDEPRYHFNLGVALRDLGRDEEAIAAYSDALEQDPRYASALVNRATRYTDLGRYRDAVADLNRYLEIEPGDPDGLYNRGLAFQGLEQWERAKRDFDASIAAGNGGEKVYRHRATVRWELGDTEGAEQDFTAALLINPVQPRSLVGRGMIRARAGRLDEARADFRLATEVAPEQPEVWINYGASWAEDDPQKALPLIIRGYRLMDPDDPRRPQIASEIRRLGGEVPE